MPNLNYKKYNILATCQLDRPNCLWVPLAAITWKAKSGWASHVLNGSDLVFEKKEDAERFSAQMAKVWIDDHRSRLLRRRSDFH